MPRPSTYAPVSLIGRQYKHTKGAVKLHLMLDHEGYLPCFAVLTDGKVSDIAEARKLDLQPGTVL